MYMLHVICNCTFFLSLGLNYEEVQSALTDQLKAQPSLPPSLRDVERSLKEKEMRRRDRGDNTGKDKRNNDVAASRMSHLRKRERSPDAGGAGVSDVVCSKCGKRGHKEDTCYSKTKEGGGDVDGVLPPGLESTIVTASSTNTKAMSNTPPNIKKKSNKKRKSNSSGGGTGTGSNDNDHDNDDEDLFAVNNDDKMSLLSEKERETLKSILDEAEIGK